MSSPAPRYRPSSPDRIWIAVFVSLIVADLVLGLVGATLARPIVGVVGGTLLAGAIGIGQIVAGPRTDRPRWTLASSALLGLLLVISGFARLYDAMSTSDPSAFSEDLAGVDGLYLTLTVFSTTGFGDITPESQAARSAVTAQMALTMAFGAVVLTRITQLALGDD